MGRAPFSLKGLAAGAVLLAAAAAGLAWFLTLPAVFTGPEGYAVAVPRGWEVRMQEGGLFLAGPGERSSRSEGRVEFRPAPGTIEWPEAAIDLFGLRPDEYRTSEIDGRRAVVSVFTEGDRRFLGAVVDRGDGLIVLRIGCPRAVFEANRSLFERMARRMRCGRR